MAGLPHSRSDLSYTPTPACVRELPTPVNRFVEAYFAARQGRQDQFQGRARGRAFNSTFKAAMVTPSLM